MNKEFSCAYFDEECKSVFLKGKEAKEMVLPAFGERDEVSKAVCIDGFSLQNLRNMPVLCIS